MVNPVKLHNVAHRDAMEESRYPFSSNNRRPSSLDPQLHQQSHSAFQRYPRMVHNNMASQQYYYFPVDDSRYDNHWVHSPSPRRVVPSSLEPCTVNAATTTTQGHQDDPFEAWCRKVTAVHDDVSVTGEDDDIEFEAIESPACRTVSISNSTITTMNDDGDDGGHHEDGSESSSSPASVMFRRGSTTSPTLLDDAEQMDIDQRLIDQGFNNGVPYDHDQHPLLSFNNNGVHFDYDAVDAADAGASQQVVQGFTGDIKLAAIVGSSASPCPSSERSSTDATMKDDESSDYEECIVDRKAGAKRSPTKKRQTRKSKKPGKTSNSKPRSNAKGKAVAVKKDTGKNADPNEPEAPLRALSAYNFFFRDERERQLEHVPMVLDDAKCDKLLEEHWYRDRTQKRRHRKSHGKIPFTQLSKIVSSQWKLLTEEQKDFYRQVSAKDWARYQREMELYKNYKGNNGTENYNCHQQDTTNGEIDSVVEEEDDEAQPGTDLDSVLLDNSAVADNSADDYEPSEDILSAEV